MGGDADRPAVAALAAASHNHTQAFSTVNLSRMASGKAAGFSVRVGQNCGLKGGALQEKQMIGKYESR